MKSPSKRTKRLMAFAPALIVMCATAYVASGVSVVGTATGADAGVQATVAGSITTDAQLIDNANCTGAGSETDNAGAMLSGAAGDWANTLEQTNGCTLEFATNSAKGAVVTYNNAFNAIGDPDVFFCLDGDANLTDTVVTRDCSTDNTRAENAGDGVAIGNASDQFGLALTGLTGGGSADLQSGAYVAGAGLDGAGATATPVATPGTSDAVWYGITKASKGLCHTKLPDSTDAACTFKFGGSGEGATQASGRYYGRASFVITANP